MSTPTQDDWMQTVLAIPKERFSTPEATGTPPPKPPTPAETVKAILANAQTILEDAQALYRENKAGASQSTFAAGIEDPGPKVDEQAKLVAKGVADATAALKQNDPAKARKAAEAAQAAAQQAHKLATGYGAAFDTAAATKQVQVTNTPWGMLSLPLEASTGFDTFVAPLTRTIEMDKNAQARFHALSEETHKKIAPLMPYLSAPEKAAAEILKFSSLMSVQWAEGASTGKLLKEFMTHYKKTLQIALDQARGSLSSARSRLEAYTKKTEAAEKREAAERANKLIDTLVDVIVGTTKLLIAPAEEIAGEAGGVIADIVGGMIKTFKGSNLLQQAAALEAEAKTLEDGALTLDVDTAQQAIQSLDGQLTTLSPLADGAGQDAERKVIRAAATFDKDCDSSPHGKDCKFRFHLVTEAQSSNRRASAAADERSRMWMGAGVNLDLLVGQLEKYSYWFQDNSKTVQAAKADIKQHTEESQAKIKEVQDVGERLDLLFAGALESLTKSHMP